MEEFERFLSKYDYNLPERLIAKAPAKPRDKARLLVCKKEKEEFSYDVFSNIAHYLPPKAVLVFNETKVLPARLVAKKETGGKVVLLYLKKNNGLAEFLSDRKLNVGSKVFLDNKTCFTVHSHEGKTYFLKPMFAMNKLYALLEKHGQAPIPPYIKKSPLSRAALKKEYQAVFAKYFGSVAAPTASLHFTKKLIQDLKKQGFGIKFITLHVGLGTFAPLAEDNIKSGKLHSEFYKIDPKTARFLNNARKEGRPVMAVGTTVARALESSAEKSALIRRLSGETSLFITEGYVFKAIDGIITNFHLPKSSLMMLVASFMGREKLLQAYSLAIRKNFKFYSFGDGMLIC